LARRASFLHEDVKTADFYFLVDAGGFSRGSDPNSLLLNEYLAKGMTWLNYSAINLGYREWGTKATFLKKIELTHQATFLCANVYLKDSGKSVFAPYVIKEFRSEARDRSLPFKKLKVAVIGLTDNLMSQLFVNKPGEPVLEYRDPVEVAKELMPQIREKADLVVLLYYGKFQKMQSVLAEVPGFDVAVLGGETYMLQQQSKSDLKTIMVSSQSMGKYVGVLHLKLDKKKNIVSSSIKQVPLDENIKDDPKFQQLVHEFEEQSQKPPANR